MKFNKGDIVKYNWPNPHTQWKNKKFKVLENDSIELVHLESLEGVEGFHNKGYTLYLEKKKLKLLIPKKSHLPEWL